MSDVTVLTAEALTALIAELTKPISADRLGDGSISTPKIADGSISTPKIADGAITAVKMDPSLLASLGDGGGGGGTSTTILGVANVRDYGATGDGITNDVAAVKATLNYLKSVGGGTILFPKGTYNLSAWTYPSYLVDFPLAIIGYGEFSTIVGPKSPSAQPFLTNKANFVCENICIDGFQDVFDFTPTTTMLGHIRIENVRFTDYSRAAVKWAENNVNGGCQRIYVENCRMLGINATPQYGLNLSTPIFQKLEINGNTIDNITDRGIYIGSTTLSLQDSRENVNITRNNVGNIYNPSTTTAEGQRAADGIQVMATNAVIAENYLYDIDNYAKQDCEGIYTKCKFAIIARNHLVNAGGGEAMIDIKGNGRSQVVMANCTNQTNVTSLTVTNLIYGLTVGMYIDIMDSTTKNQDGTDVVKIAQRKILTMDYPNGIVGISGAAITTASTDYIQKFARAKGYGVLCINNTLVDGREYGALIPETGEDYNTTGIKINNDDVKVEGNLLEGFTYNAISVGGSTYSNIDIRGNKIRKIRGIGGIGIGGLGTNFVIDNNQIYEVTGETTTGTAYGINVGGSAKDVVISNNQIRSITQSGVTTSGISVKPSTLMSISNVTIKNNTVKTAGRGINFSSNPSDDVWVYGNKIQDCSSSNIYYSTVAPTNLVVGTNNPTLALPTPIDPSTIAGLSAWFDASSITGLTDGAAVSSWTDKSVTNVPLTQATPASQPTYVANALNGKAVVAFNGAQNMKTALWAAPLAQPFTMFLVVKLDMAYLFDGLSSASRVYLRNSSATPGGGGLYYFNSGATLSSYPVNADANYHLFTLRANAAGGIKIDGTTVTGDPSSPTPQSLNGLTLGSLYSNGSYATARVGEILIYNSDISPYNAAQIEYYLKSKWGVGG